MQGNVSFINYSLVDYTTNVGQFWVDYILTKNVVWYKNLIVQGLMLLYTHMLTLSLSLNLLCIPFDLQFCKYTNTNFDTRNYKCESVIGKIHTVT